MNQSINILTAILFVILLISIPQGVSQELATLNVEIKYTNGDRVDFNGLKLVVFQDYQTTPILEKNMEKNPDSLSLPADHKYKVEVYGNGMYGDVGYAELTKSSKNIEINIPLSGGLQLNVFYKDGQTPISDATVVIKSHDGEELRKGKTNMMGETIRYWIQSTNRQTDYYIAEVYLGDILIAKESQIKVQEGIAQDKKITTRIPETIEDLITISLYNNTAQKISKEDGKFSVQLKNVKDKTVKTSDVTPRGDAYFSNIASGEYTTYVLKDGVLDSEWEITKVPIIGEQKNFKLYRNILTKDNTEAPIFEKKTLSCNCVAFRFDDVQDYWLNKVQAEYVNVFVEEQIPLTVGIITDSFGDDPIITDMIKKSMKKGFIEVANHGVGNSPFTDFSKQKQQELINESINNMERTLNVKSKIFVPPQNKFNNDTIDLLIENGFTHLSSSLIQGDVPPFPLENQTLYRFPQITTTGVYDAKENIFVGVNRDITFSEIKQGLENYGFAVITSHPQEFAIVKDGTYTNEVNQQQINELKSLIQKIKLEGIKIVRISQINIDADKVLIPDWIRNNAGWWAEGQIDDETFVQGLQYLIKEEIMKIPSTVQGTESNSIPDWVRNNARWWAEGQISDTDFVTGIQYLVTKGIITY